MHSQGNLEAYNKVYVAPIKNDVAKVLPRLLGRLQKAGFNAVEYKAENLPFTSQGSGFVLSPEGHVLTCAHVVGNQTNATLWIEGTRHLGRVVACDTNLDAAIIVVEGAPSVFHTVGFASDCKYQLGQDAFTMGFPLANILGSKPRLNKGLISSVVGLQDDPMELQISTEVQPGNSGGPLLNAQGEAIGMVAATINPWKVFAASGGTLPQNINFAIKAAPLLDFLAESKVSMPSGGRSTNSFEDITKSVALIRGGVVDEQRLKEKPLLCRCFYLALPGDHFGRIRIEFLDVTKISVVLTNCELRQIY